MSNVNSATMENDSDEEGFGIGLLQERTEFLNFEAWTIERLPAPLPPRLRFRYSHCGGKKFECTCTLPICTALLAEASSSGGNRHEAFAEAAAGLGMVILAWVWLSLPCVDVRVSARHFDPDQVRYYGAPIDPYEWSFSQLIHRHYSNGNIH